MTAACCWAARTLQWNYGMRMEATASASLN